MKQGQIIRLDSKEHNEYIRAYLVNTEDIQSPDDQIIKSLYEMLPEFRKDKVDSIKNGNAKIQSIAAFGLLGYGLRRASQDPNCKFFDHEFMPARAEEWEELGYVSDKHGKPYFEKKPEIHFSLSHTGGMVMCVISDRPVGCDVEVVNRYKVDYDIHTYAEERLRLAGRFFTEAEYEYLKTSKSDTEIPQKFTEIWTKKESYIKFLGLGLSKPLNEFNTQDCSPRPEMIYEDGKYCASICVDLKS